MFVEKSLSGGISSTIAGGNFWDGFRQGIITSGLNHLGHLGGNTVIKKVLQNRLEKTLGDSGVNNDCTTKQALEILQIVFKDMWSLGSGWAKFADEAGAISEWESNDSQKISINKNGNLVAGAGNPAWGITNSKGQMIYAISLHTGPISRFAEVFLHELVHSIDYVSGFYKTFWRLPNITALMEYRAYKYVYDWTGIKDPNQDNFKVEMGYTPKFLLNYSF
ncbi:hypothetical protein LIV57_05725 [Chryseobacterium sp. X308]|uniref:hypothetical protein n=1 Tax=Chryseobacterium sp. X308 TaxID=2884873 RepID=UPI001D1574F4|nr:hypothetical protein [Chryseobacterium sp. X308]MCC3214761.1 hypothetical protein [Chryseobacterium sp. X308]